MHFQNKYNNFKFTAQFSKLPSIIWPNLIGKVTLVLIIDRHLKIMVIISKSWLLFQLKQFNFLIRYWINYKNRVGC